MAAFKAWVQFCVKTTQSGLALNSAAPDCLAEKTASAQVSASLCPLLPALALRNFMAYTAASIERDGLKPLVAALSKYIIVHLVSVYHTIYFITRNYI